MTNITKENMPNVIIVGVGSSAAIIEKVMAMYPGVPVMTVEELKPDEAWESRYHFKEPITIHTLPPIPEPKIYDNKPFYHKFTKKRKKL